MSLGPIAKTGIGCVICTFAGLFSFYLAKVSVEKQRYDNMKARQRMRISNQGEYEKSARNFPSTN